MKKNYVKLEKEFDEWLRRNGACKINYHDENILLYNGGLFQDCDDKGATLWVGDVDDSINYLRRLRRLLHKQGIKTDTSCVAKRKKK